MANKSTTVPSLSDLTVQQILDVMRPNGQVLAVGKYQAIPVTFKAWVSEKNIPKDSVFNSSLQEQLGDWLIAGKRPKIGRFVNGDPSVTVEEAQLELAKEFASVPVPYALYRPKGAGGKSDPGGPVEKGQSYYYGLAGNRAASSIEKYQNALLQAKAAGSLDSLKTFIARGEGTYDALNRGRAGDTSTYSPEYYNALSRAGAANQPISQPTTPTTQPTTTIPTTRYTQQVPNYNDYIEKIYKNPFRTDRDVQNEVLNRELPLFKQYLSNLRGVNYSANAIGNNLTIITDQDLQGDLLLIDGINATQAKKQEQVKTLVDDKLKAFTPDAKYSLINSKLFEMFPDNMRNKIAENSADGGASPNYSHAWRAPGKLSVTADFTISGISGLRIGQIFWIDRISEAYRQYGAFQLFGLTEKIDISQGWTTSIHSRFNALPRKSGAQYLIDSTQNGSSTETATQSTIRN
jgi:hypothetical protein